MPSRFIVGSAASLSSCTVEPRHCAAQPVKRRSGRARIVPPRSCRSHRLRAFPRISCPLFAAAAVEVSRG